MPPVTGSSLSIARASDTASARATAHWGPSEQASLLLRALAHLGIERPVVVGHSWGALVALAMALESPEDVAGLVLLSGYYYPYRARKSGSPARFRSRALSCATRLLPSSGASWPPIR